MTCLAEPLMTNHPTAEQKKKSVVSAPLCYSHGTQSHRIYYIADYLSGLPPHDVRLL